MIINVGNKNRLKSEKNSNAPLKMNTYTIYALISTLNAVQWTTNEYVYVHIQT